MGDYILAPYESVQKIIDRTLIVQIGFASEDIPYSMTYGELMRDYFKVGNPRKVRGIIGYDFGIMV